MARKAKIEKPGRTKRSFRTKYGWPRRIATHPVVLGLLAIALILAALPAVFTLIYKIPGTQPGSTLMLGRALIGKPVDRRWVDFDEIAEVVPQSVIMSEDGQFCFHRGVDWGAINEVIDDALEGEKTRGASTLPMQTVKNLFFWPQRSFIRKGLEIPYAIFADTVLTKRRVMEIYLNIAEFDEGVFGIEAASQHYFKKPASKLTRRQAALLTVSLPNPVKRNPAKPSKSLSRLAKRIERLSAKSGSYVRCLYVEGW